MWDKDQVIIAPHLKAACTSFCSIKFYGLWCQKPFEDRLISYPYVFHFQHRLKSCLLRQTCFCRMICSKTWLVTVQQFISLEVILCLIVNEFSTTFDIKSNREIDLMFLSITLNNLFKQKFCFCYLALRRKCIKCYRQIDNISYMNSYHIA